MHKQLLRIKSIIMKEGGGAKRGNEEKITRRKEKDFRKRNSRSKGDQTKQSSEPSSSCGLQRYLQAFQGRPIVKKGENEERNSRQIIWVNIGLQS